jgi:2-haloacid dehalogenase
VELHHQAETLITYKPLGAQGRPFSDHLRAALEVVIGEAGLDFERVGVAEALAVAASLPARPGAAEALGRLRDAGVCLIALTNSGAQDGRRTLQRCGLAPYFEMVLGVDAVNTFKPHPDVYAYALSQLKTKRARVALAATHPWDLAGAAHGGLDTAWVRHGPRVWPEVFAPPGTQADSLPELVHTLLAEDS